MHSTLLRVAAAILFVSATACASAGGGRSGNSNILSAAQISGTRANNIYEAVEMLRPAWLSSRGPSSMTDPTPTEASVYLNGIRVGGLEYLKTVTATDIAEIRYYPASEAIGRFGMGHPRGVIEIIPKGT